MQIDAVQTDTAARLIPTRGDVERLKAHWLADDNAPDDLGATPGYEAHREELTAYAVEVLVRRDRRERDRRLDEQRAARDHAAARRARASSLGCSLALLAVIEGLEDRMRDLRLDLNESDDRAARAEARWRNGRRDG